MNRMGLSKMNRMLGLSKMHRQGGAEPLPSHGSMAGEGMATEKVRRLMAAYNSTILDQEAEIMQIKIMQKRERDSMEQERKLMDQRRTLLKQEIEILERERKWLLKKRKSRKSSCKRRRQLIESCILILCCLGILGVSSLIAGWFYYL